MYIVLLSYSNKLLLDFLLDAIRKRFPFIKFSVRGTPDSGWQLRLDGENDEHKPRAFAEGFIAAYECSISKEFKSAIRLEHRLEKELEKEIK